MFKFLFLSHQTTLPASTPCPRLRRPFHPVRPPAYRRDSRIIVTLTRGSVRQPEDLLLEIETRHLSDFLSPNLRFPSLCCLQDHNVGVPDRTLLR